MVDGNNSNDGRHSTTLALAIFFVSAFMLIVPLSYLASAATNGFFSTSAVVNGVTPAVSVDSGQAISGVTGGSKTVNIFFNASDGNGWSDLNDSSATVVITRGGETTRTSTSCSLDGVTPHPNSDSSRYNCSLTLYFYDASGPWTINASIKDNENQYDDENSVTVNVGDLDAISLVSASVSFTGSPNTNNVAASPNPQRVNNTGNQNYTSMTVKGYSFASGTNFIGVGNVTMNITDTSGAGTLLVNNTATALAGANLSKGNGNMRDVYFWLDIPTGVPPGTYNAQNNWEIAVS